VSERQPLRGDIWIVDFSPVRAHEEGGIRPGLVVSPDLVNKGPSKLVALVPLTSRDRGIAAHIPISPPEGGLTRPSFILCDQARIASQDRLHRRIGSVTQDTLAEVEQWLRDFFGL
jgi:mRNA interferase MazF